MKKVLLSLFTVLASLSLFTVNAEEIDSMTTNDLVENVSINEENDLVENNLPIEKVRSQDNNYGVNKKWEVTSSNKINVLTTPFVDANEKIYDYADILTDSEEIELKSLIDQYVSKTNMDLVILSTDLAYSDYLLEDYAADFYDYNDFGINFDYYSGSILIINMNSYNRFYNIYTFGNAIRYYSDSRLENILDNIYYDIADASYFNGFKKFISEETTYYELGIPDSNKYSHISEDDFKIVYDKAPYGVPLIPCLIISAIVTLVVMLILVKKNKMVKKATEAKEYINKDSIKYDIKEDRFVNTHTSSYRVSSSTSSGGSSISHGSSGGFHGGGSGRHF